MWCIFWCLSKKRYKLTGTAWCKTLTCHSWYCHWVYHKLLPFSFHQAPTCYIYRIKVRRYFFVHEKITAASWLLHHRQHGRRDLDEPLRFDFLWSYLKKWFSNFWLNKKFFSIISNYFLFKQMIGFRLASGFFVSHLIPTTIQLNISNWLNLIRHI